MKKLSDALFFRTSFLKGAGRLSLILLRHRGEAGEKQKNTASLNLRRFKTKGETRATNANIG
jgi:hypothetical protein